MSKVNFNFSSLKGFEGDGYVFATFTDQVLIGRYINKEFIFAKDCNKDFLTELVIFNEKQQYKYTKSTESGEFKEDIYKYNKNDRYFNNDVYLKGQSIEKDEDIDGVKFTWLKADNSSYPVPLDLKDSKCKLIVQEYYDFDDTNSIINKRTCYVGFDYKKED